MNEHADIEYNALILCEDIRQEIDGKRTLLGVFTSNSIQVPYLPIHITFALFAAGWVRRAGAFRPSLLVEDFDYNTIYRDNAFSIHKLHIGRFTQNLQVSLEIKRIGPLRFSLLHGDDRVASVSHTITTNSDKGVRAVLGPA